LLTDADLGVQRLGVGERLVIVACHRVRQILLDIGALRQDGHQRVAIVAGWAEGPEPFHIRNCHNFYSLTRRKPGTETRGQTPVSTRRKRRALGHPGTDPRRNPGTAPSVHAAQKARLGTLGSVPRPPSPPGRSWTSPASLVAGRRPRGALRATGKAGNAGHCLG